MTILSRNQNEITYIYNSQSSFCTQMLGYLRGIDKEVSTIDIANKNLGDATWIELADSLKMPFEEIFSKAHPDVPNLKNSAIFDIDDWLTIINLNPVLLQRPILFDNNKIRLISNKSEILQFFGVASAGLEKTMSYKEPKTSATTRDENFID